MYSWNSSKMLVADDTLVLLKLLDKENRIPARTPDGHPIRVVGDDSVLASRDDSIMIEEGIEAVGAIKATALYLPTTVKKLGVSPASAFGSTRRIVIWRRLTDEQWRTVQSASIAAAGGQSIYTGTLEAIGLDRSLEGWRVTWIPEDAEELLYARDPLSGRDQLLKELPCLGVRRKAEEASVIGTLTRIARTGAMASQSPQAERIADSFLRAAAPDTAKRALSPAAKERTGFLTTVGAPVRAAGGSDVLVCFTLQFAAWSFCSLLPVTWHGGQYYIGCLNELTRDASIPYIRRELAVFSKEGLVSDRATAEGVYAKFLLMSCL